MPGPNASSYQLAYRKAAVELAGRKLEEVARRCGATLNGRRLILPFFGRRVEVRLAEEPGCEVEVSPQDLPLAEKILILHYLSSTGNQPRREELVSFKQLPGASFYEPTYRRRGPERIAGRFGSDPDLFRKACNSLGWPAAGLGDESCSLPIFPRLQAIVVLHRGDEELPAEANLLFNNAIGGFLPLEDVAVLAGLIANRLVKAV
jgi:hypothetical protein